jgi:hypothetical protein
MNKDLRMWLGIGLLVIALFYKGGFPSPLTPDKLEKPEAEVITLVENISVSDDADSSKLAGMFNALSEKLDSTTLNTNLQVQYLMNAIGKGVFEDELLAFGEPKYPEFAPAVAEAMTKVLGPQTDTDPITGDEKRKLARLFYGLSWKLYKSSHDDEYESYKSKALSAIAEYNQEDDEPIPDPDEVEDCPCEGKGYIIHGDGHRTKCPCVESGKDCEHDPKCGSIGTAPEQEPTLPPAKSDLSQAYPIVPDIRGYRPQVGVAGMTVRNHLVMGAAGQHAPVPAAFVDSLTINQKYWLHDFLHGMVTNTTISNSGVGCEDGSCAIGGNQIFSNLPRRRGLLWWRR